MQINKKQITNYISPAIMTVVIAAVVGFDLLRALAAGVIISILSNESKRIMKSDKKYREIMAFMGYLSAFFSLYYIIFSEIDTFICVASPIAAIACIFSDIRMRKRLEEI